MVRIFALTTEYFRSLFNAWRGGASFAQFFYSCWLGMALGLLPYSLLTFVLLACFIFFNLNLVLVVLFWALTHLLSLFAAASINTLGKSILQTGIEPFANWLSQVPMLAWMRFDTPHSWGALAILFTFGVFLSFFIAKMLRQLRRMAEQQNTNVIINLLVDRRQGIQNAYQVHKLISIHRIGTACLMLPILLYSLLLYADREFGYWLKDEISHFSGSEIIIDDAEISIFDGEFELDQISIMDASNNQSEKLRLKDIEGQLDSNALWRRQILLEHAHAEIGWFEFPRTQAQQALKIEDAQAIKFNINEARHKAETYADFVNMLQEDFTAFLPITNYEASLPWYIESFTINNMQWMPNLPNFVVSYYNLSPIAQEQEAIDLDIQVEPNSLKALKPAPKEKNSLKNNLKKAAEDIKKKLLDQ